MSDTKVTQQQTPARKAILVENADPSAASLDPARDGSRGEDFIDGFCAGPLRMPESSDEERPDLRNALRKFHFTGVKPGPDLDAASGAPWHPAVLTPWLQAGRTVLQESGTGEADAEALPGQLAQAAESLPKEATLLGLGNRAVLDQYAAAIGRYRRIIHEEFRDEVKALTGRLNDRLQIDRMHSPEGTTPQSLSAAMGNGAESYFDAEALAGSLPEHRGTRHMGPDRRRRIEQIVEVLEEFVETAETGPDFVLVHSGPLPDGVHVPPDAMVESVDSFAAAIDLFDRTAAELVSVIRALRTARLEVADRYEPGLHDEPLSRLDGESLSPEELVLARTIVVFETFETLQDDTASSLSRVLHSGRPIHVLITNRAVDPKRPRAETVLGPRDPGLGYRSVAHREAFVLQTTLVEPEHLAEGLEELVRAVRPAVAFVEGHPWSADDALPLLRSTAEHQGRASLCFRYDPDAGATWAACFSLSCNPQPEEMWPRYSIPYAAGDDGKEEWTLRFTFADCAALDPAYRDHFCVIPPCAWAEDQIPLADYLDGMDSEPPAEIPFIWAVDQDGFLQRAVLTRELALTCRERMRSWRILQELGGIENEYACRAAEREREEAERKLATLRSELEAAHAAEVEKVRAEVAEETVHRLVAGLMGLESVPPPIPDVPSPAAVRPEATPEAATSPSVVEEQPADQAPPVRTDAQEEDQAEQEDPYIDTALCTTCDECTNINPRLFKYDENKQAYLADANAGTFADLVKAAELCPAHCIHPGTPRSDDKTATQSLRAKAAELN